MSDEMYMKRAIELARLGEGWCHPNPMVGAVIVKDGKIIGEGYHRKCGELHAERNAFLSLKESAAGATIYVTLEPCCHYGKTPPCTEAIIENGITKVVIGSRDPNPKVAGKGVKQLRDNGIEVVEDFLREECDKINPVFFHYITTKTPYVVMKYASTLDGKIATKTGASKWITGEKARQEVQKMRHAYMGIMAGIGTVLEDDPLLNCRLENGRSPIRIICDSSVRIPLDSQIVKTACEYETIIASATHDLPIGEIEDLSDATNELMHKCKILMENNIKIVNFPQEDSKGVDLRRLMEYLGEEGIDSILLEGGGTLNESALSQKIVHEVKAFFAPKIFGGKGKSPVEGVGVEYPDEATMLKLENIKQIGEDLMVTFTIRD